MCVCVCVIGYPSPCATKTLRHTHGAIVLLLQHATTPSGAILSGAWGCRFATADAGNSSSAGATAGGGAAGAQRGISSSSGMAPGGSCPAGGGGGPLQVCAQVERERIGLCECVVVVGLLLPCAAAINRHQPPVALRSLLITLDRS